MSLKNMALNNANNNRTSVTNKAGNNPPKRAALGVLNSNQAFERDQQSKIFNWVKYEGHSKKDDENPQRETLVSQKFSIFEDGSMDVSAASRTPELAEEIARLICDSTGTKKENNKENKDIQSPDHEEEPMYLEETRKDHLNWTCPFSEDIYAHMRQLETCGRPHPYYIYKQKDITTTMRTILVDWMIEVGEEYKLESETIHLAVTYTDRFLSKMAVMRDKLQLVGTAALFTASKFEEIYPPEVKEFAYITDNTYTKKQIIRMEHLLLEVLDFTLSPPTVLSFCLHYCSLNSASEMVSCLAQYLCDISMLETDPFLNFLPSEMAAACLALSNYVFGCPVWPDDLVETTGYSLQDIKVAVHCLYNTYNSIKSSTTRAVRDKFGSSKFKRVSEIPCPGQLDI